MPRLRAQARVGAGPALPVSPELWTERAQGPGSTCSQVRGQRKTPQKGRRPLPCWWDAHSCPAPLPGFMSLPYHCRLHRCLHAVCHVVPAPRCTRSRHVGPWPSVLCRAGLLAALAFPRLAAGADPGRLWISKPPPNSSRWGPEHPSQSQLESVLCLPRSLARDLKIHL